MLKLRIVTVAVALPLFLAALFLLPSAWWAVLMLVLLLVGGHEWARLAGFTQISEAAFLAGLFTACVLLWLIKDDSMYSLGPADVTVERAVYALSLVFWCVVAPYWLSRKSIVRNAGLLAAAGLVVLVPMWLALVQLQVQHVLLLILLAVIWISDSAAYFTGRAIGKHKLAPAISPGKTWEGVAGALAAVTVYAFVVQRGVSIDFKPYIVIAAFVGIACLGILGDLFESWIKRSAGVKDSGGIFPGHGGILDRVDALTAAMPAAALVFTNAS